MTSRQTKVCSICKEIKPLSEYHKKGTGTRVDCKLCRKKESKQYYNKNKKKINQKCNTYYKKNKEKVLTRAREYHKENRLERNKYSSQWKRQNRKHCNALNALREAKKIQATPAWADIEGMMFFYACCPDGWHVDHEVPLAGEIASGLHTLDNLQYLPDKINIAKSNKWPWPEDLYDDKFN